MKVNEQNKVATKCRVDPFAALMENVIWSILYFLYVLDDLDC